VTASTFELRFCADVERLDDAGIDGGNNIYGTVQIMIGNTGFPCVRKAAFDSRLAVSDHGDGESHKDLFAFGQAGDTVRIAVELPEIGLFGHGTVLPESHQISVFTGGIGGLRNRLVERHLRTVVRLAVAGNWGNRSDLRSPEEASGFGDQTVGMAGVYVKRKRLSHLTVVFRTGPDANRRVGESQQVAAGCNSQSGHRGMVLDLPVVDGQDSYDSRKFERGIGPRRFGRCRGSGASEDIQKPCGKAERPRYAAHAIPPHLYGSLSDRFFSSIELHGRECQRFWSREGGH
jgi:hypothetical protein